MRNECMGIIRVVGLKSHADTGSPLKQTWHNSLGFQSKV
jgi:hypothetical protein